MPSDRSVRRYFKWIGSEPLMTRGDEVEAGNAIRNGDAEAFQALVRANLRLVVRIAHEFSHRGVELDELVAAGNVGLLRAAGAFDPAFGTKFSSYAAWWIKQAMRQCICANSTIYVPLNAARQYYDVRNAAEEFLETHGHSATLEELSQITGLKPVSVKRLLSVPHCVGSLQEAIMPGEELERARMVADPNAEHPAANIEREEAQERIEQLLAPLDDRERLVVNLRLGLDGHHPCTLESVSAKIGITREGIRQVYKKALMKMRAEHRGKKFTLTT